MSDNVYRIPVEEMQRHTITWETVQGGQSHAFIYVVTPEEYNQEVESFIGYVLRTDLVYSWFDDNPLRFTYDGLLYPNNISEKEVEEIIGKELLEYHKKRMHAIRVLQNIESKPLGYCTECKGVVYNQTIRRSHEGETLCQRCYEEKYPDEIDCLYDCGGYDY
jgi:hypothetical protein